MKMYLKTLYMFCKNAYIRDKGIPGFVIGGVLFEFIEIAVTVIMFNVIFDNTKSLGGWSFYQTLFLYAFVKVIFALNNTFFKGGIRSLAREMIREGTLDFHLTKPMNSLILMVMSKPKIYPLINGFFASLLAAYAIIVGNIPVTFAQFLWLIFLTFFSMILYVCLQLIIVIPVFWLTKVWALQSIMGRISQFMRYPARMFPPVLKTILLIIFPVLTVSYVPVATFIEPPRALLIFFIIFATLVFSLLTQLFWNLGLRKYTSASS